MSTATISKEAFARSIIAALSAEQLDYAADPARGRWRGWPSLEDAGVVDPCQLALDCDLPEPDGTMERLELINEYYEAATKAMIAHWEGLHHG